MNIQIFQAVLKIQNFITHIPAQVERQQPVYLIDAFGRQSPFHLEFVRSAKALTAVLKANFSKTGQARKKIGRGEFVIQDSLKKRDINIFDDWDKSFYPGQRVEMSVVLQCRWQAGSSCPGCGMVCKGSTEADVQCTMCDMTFRRIIEIEEDESPQLYGDPTHQEPVLHEEASLVSTNASLFSKIEAPGQASKNYKPRQIEQKITQNRRRKREYARDDELELDIHLDNIRRVRIQNVSRGVTDRFDVMFGYFEEDGQPESALCYGFRTQEDESCLIIELGDNKSNALCDTITQQMFKLGGLFPTELVTAESIIEDVEENERQITWMEDPEVQMYLRFKSKRDRETIWAFIISAQSRWRLRSGSLPHSPSTLTLPASSEPGLFSLSSASANLSERELPKFEDIKHSSLLTLAENKQSTSHLEGLEFQYRDLRQFPDLERDEESLGPTQGYDKSNDEWCPTYEDSSDVEVFSQEPFRHELNATLYLPFDDVSASYDGTPTPLQNIDIAVDPFNGSNTPGSYNLKPDQNPPPPHATDSAFSAVTSHRGDRPLPLIIVDDPSDTLAMKRARNTLAARRSRQQKVERFGEMEERIGKL